MVAGRRGFARRSAGLLRRRLPVEPELQFRAAGGGPMRGIVRQLPKGIMSMATSRRATACLTVLFLLAGIVCLSAESSGPVEQPKTDSQEHALAPAALHQAAEQGSVPQIEALLAAGADVNGRDGYGNTPLLLAARAGREDAAELLLKHGADPKAAAYNKYTPLHMAAWSGSAKIIKSLLEKGADVNAPDYNYRKPLNYASTKSAVELLVSAGAEANAANLPPLPDAALHGFPDAVTALLDHGADIQGVDTTYYTPLHWAAWGGSADTVRVLIQRGADVHYRDNWGWTPLSWAEHWDYPQIVSLLRQKMAETPFKTDERHW